MSAAASVTIQPETTFTATCVYAKLRREREAGEIDYMILYPGFTQGFKKKEACNRLHDTLSRLYYTSESAEGACKHVSVFCRRYATIMASFILYHVTKPDKTSKYHVLRLSLFLNTAYLQCLFPQPPRLPDCLHFFKLCNALTSTVRTKLLLNNP